MNQQPREIEDRRFTYCMNVLKNGTRCNTEIPFTRFKTHGAVCNSCEESKQIKAPERHIVIKQLSCNLHHTNKALKGTCVTCDSIL